MSWAQITTTRRYTKREKQAYRARVNKRRDYARMWTEYNRALAAHHYADNLGSRVPTQRVNRDFL